MSGGSWQQDLFSLLRLRRLGTILFLVAIWYYFSYEYNTRLKAWLSDSKTHHATLDTQGVTTTAQQLAAAATTWLSPVTMPLLIAIFLSTTVATMPWVLHAYAVTPELLPAWQYLWTHHTLDMGLMCASTVMGTSTITVVYEYGSIQLVQVARSVGPLFTTVWAVLLLDQVTKDKPLACLFASLAGTLLASWKEPTLCMMTVVLMLAANSCMTFRNAITRRLLGHLGISHHHHAAPKQVEHNHGARSSPQRAFSDPYQPDFSSIPATHMASWLLTTGNAAGCATLMVLLLVGGMSGARAMVELYNMPFSSVSRLMVLGGTNWAYNLASQLVLAQLTVVSHGMLELLKRVFVLVAVSFFSQKANWQWHNVAGAVITFVAAAFYFHYSHAAPSAPKAPHPSHPDTKAQPSDSTAADSKSASSGVVVFLQSVTGAHRSDVIQSPTRRDQGKEKLLSSAGSSGGGALIDGSAVISVTYPGQSDKDANAAGYQEPPPGHAAVQAFSPRRSWLPPAGPRRVSLARTAIIAIMLCSVPLLMPSDFWGFLSADGMGGSRIQLVTQHKSAFQPPGQWVQASAPHVTVPGSDSGAVKLTPSTDTAADNKDRRSLGRTDKQAASVQAGRGERGGRERGRARAGGKGKGSGGNRAHIGLQAKIPGSAAARTATTSTGAATSGARTATNGTQQRTLKGLYDSALYGIYLGWLGHDNLGDDIVADIFYELLRQSIQSQAPEGAVVQVTKDLDPQLSWKLPGCGRAKAYDQCHFAVIGGGSTVDVPFIMAARDMLAAKRPVLLFGGGYQRVYHNAELQKTSLELLMGAGTLGGIRGPITESFLLNRTQSTLPIIGDSGFLSDALFPGSGLTIASQLPAKIMPGQPIPHWPPAPECMTANRPVHTRDNQVTKSMHAPLPSEAPGSLCERPLVVATLRTDLVSSDLNKDLKFLNSDTDIEQLKVPRHPIAIMMLMIEELVNEHHFQVVLQAVDDKSLMAHERYIDMINRRIKPGNPLVVLHNEHADYNQVMELYERAAVTVNCRLHSGVLAAAALRPTIYMASLPKFADFMASIEQDEYMVKPDRWDKPEMASLGSTELAKLLVSKVLSATNNAAAISSKLQTIRDDMLKKYKEAMRTLTDRLATDHPAKFKSVIQDCSSISIKRSTCLSERTVIYIQCLNSANTPSTGQQSIQY